MNGKEPSLSVKKGNDPYLGGIHRLKQYLQNPPMSRVTPPGQQVSVDFHGCVLIEYKINHYPCDILITDHDHPYTALFRVRHWLASSQLQTNYSSANHIQLNLANEYTRIVAHNFNPKEFLRYPYNKLYGRIYINDRWIIVYVNRHALLTYNYTYEHQVLGRFPREELIILTDNYHTLRVWTL